MKGMFFVAGEAGTQKSEIVQKAMEILKSEGKDVVLFKPFGNENEAMFSLSTAKQMICTEQQDSLMAQVVAEYKELESKHDFVIVDGTSLDSSNQVIEFDLNTKVASALCLPTVLVMQKQNDVLQSTDYTTRMLTKKYSDVIGTLTSLEGLDALLQKAQEAKAKYISPYVFEFSVVHQAKTIKQRMVLPEGESERILRAADAIHKRDIADLVILGKREEVLAKAKALNLDLQDVEMIDPETADKLSEYAQKYYDLRHEKEPDLTIQSATELMKDSAFFGTMMVYMGDADGMVSGAEHTTAHTIRPALKTVKTKAGVKVVSGAFAMCFNGKLSIFADCAVTPNPTSEQLAEIAITSAQTARTFGLEPKVALLSYGSGNSGKGPSVDVVKAAVELVREKDPSLLIEGPIQFDAAIDPVVAKTKLPDSKVAGQANVFVFPELNTGNCCYKAIQRTNPDSLAVGPILQGLNKPVNDLSRGCTVPDIINTVAFTALFAQKEKVKE